MSFGETQPILPCPEHLALQPVVTVEEDFEVEVVKGEDGFARLFNAGLPLAPGFVEINEADLAWLPETLL